MTGPLEPIAIDWCSRVLKIPEMVYIAQSLPRSCSRLTLAPKEAFQWAAHLFQKYSAYFAAALLIYGLICALTKTAKPFMRSAT